jgi:hypothetical protein
MYLISILWYLSWPLLIYVSYRTTLWSVKRFEKRLITEKSVSEVFPQTEFPD